MLMRLKHWLARLLALNASGVHGPDGQLHKCRSAEQPGILVLLGARSAEKRSGTGPRAGSCKKKVGGVAPAGLFLLVRWAIAQLEVYRISEHTRRRLGARSANRWGILRN